MAKTVSSNADCHIDVVHPHGPKLQAQNDDANRDIQSEHARKRPVML